MKRLILTISMLLVMIVGPNGLAAQSLDEADGLESSYGRNYSTGSSSAVSASSSSSTPEDMETEITYTGLEIIGLTFDSDENAEKFLEEMESSIQETIESDDSITDSEFKDLDELDIDKDGFFAIGAVENTGVNATVVFVDGNQVFIIDVVEADFDAATKVVTDVTKFVADAKTDTEEVSFSEDGTSTGGVFDRMPAADDELVGDLMPTDYKLFPED